MRERECVPNAEGQPFQGWCFLFSGPGLRLASSASPGFDVKPRFGFDETVRRADAIKSQSSGGMLKMGYLEVSFINRMQIGCVNLRLKAAASFQ